MAQHHRTETRTLAEPELDRNGLEVLSEAECWLLLESAHVGRLAVVLGERPEIFPVNFLVDSSGGERSVVFVTAPGSKLAGAVLGQAVAFEIDSADPLFHTGWSVVVHGHASEIELLDELVAAEALPLRAWGPGPKHHFVRVRAVGISGRRILPHIARDH